MIFMFPEVTVLLELSTPTTQSLPVTSWPRMVLVRMAEPCIGGKEDFENNYFRYRRIGQGTVMALYNKRTFLYKNLDHNAVVLLAKQCSARSDPESLPQSSTDTFVVFATKSFTAEADLQANARVFA